MMPETSVAKIKSPIQINHQTPVFLIGSCFSAVFGNLLGGKKIPVLFNPFGTVYNSVSIGKMIKNILNNKVPEPEEISKWNQVFYHYDYHSDMSSMTKNEVVLNIIKNTENTLSFLKTCKVMFITLGTSFVYQTVDNEKIVANCHKVPGSYFSKKMLSIQEMIFDLTETIHLINLHFPNIHIVFTVSPVRHVRDGLIENNRSKGRLIDTVHTLAENFDNMSYFPSYELMMDQLRDYRYYEKDLIHPNDLAHEVLWEYFSNTYFTDETRKILEKIDNIFKAFQHKPQFNNHPDYVKFCKKQLEEIDNINTLIPVISFDREKEYFLKHIPKEN